MHGGDVIREARRRAGLSQRELASRLGTHQSVVARWEARLTSPTFEAVCVACSSCGFDVDWKLAARDDDMERRIREQLKRSPSDRVASVAQLADLRMHA